MNRTIIFKGLFIAMPLLCGNAHTAADEIARRVVEGQPVAANVRRVLETLESLGAPLDEAATTALKTAVANEDGAELQTLMDQQVLFVVEINPEVRVKVKRGPGDPVLQQGGYSPVLIKVINDATLTRRLRISSPQSGPLYAGAAEGILLRQAQTELKQNENINRERRFLDVEILNQSPMTSTLRDFDGQPTTARLEFRDRHGRVYPPQAKRLAPDFFFQPQIYRNDGDVVLLPPGEFTLESSRGPEYLRQVRIVAITDSPDAALVVTLD